MDPITHAVAGMAVAASWSRASFGARHRGSGTLLAAAAIAGVAPDIDFICGFPDGKDPGLAYLLYHRGVTHTVVGCVAIALVLTLLTRPLAGKHVPASRVLAITLVAALLHVGLDATNDYGVHPFWPFWNEWIYGDFIFLLDPLIVTALLPLALSAVLQDWGSRRLNVTLLVLAAVLVLGWLILPWVRVSQGIWITGAAAGLVTLWLVGHLVLALARGTSLARSWGSVAVVLVAFAVGSFRAKSLAIEVMRKHAPTEESLTLDTTPSAANPLCWRVTFGSVDASGDIVGRMGVVSLVPSFYAPQECRTATPKELPTFRLSRLEWPTRDAKDELQWYWLGVVKTERAELREAVRNHPRVAAAMRSLRIPVLQRTCDTWILGDLRLDYEDDFAHYCKYRVPATADKSSFREGPRWVAPFLEPTELQGDR